MQRKVSQTEELPTICIGQHLPRIIRMLQCGRLQLLILSAGICSRLMQRKIYFISGTMRTHHMHWISILLKTTTAIFILLLLTTIMIVRSNVSMREVIDMGLSCPHMPFVWPLRDTPMETTLIGSHPTAKTISFGGSALIVPESLFSIESFVKGAEMVRGSKISAPFRFLVFLQWEQRRSCRICFFVN